MKKNLVFAFALASLAAQAQKINETNVPAAVMQSFRKMYPDIVQSKWEIEESNYEVKFKKADQKLEAVFSPDGKYVQLEKKLGSANDLPKEITQSLTKDFSGYKFSDAEKIELADGSVRYELEAEMGESEFELLYDSKGKLITKKAEQEKNEKKGKHKKHGKK